MYYLIDNEENLRYEDNDIDALIEECYPNDYCDEDYDDFNEYLNEEYGSITVFGNTYYASDILRENDEYDYNNAFSEWASDRLDSYRSDARYEIECIHPGAWDYIGRHAVYAYEDELEEEEEVDEDIETELEETLSRQAEQETEQKDIDKRRADDFESLFQSISMK